MKLTNISLSLLVLTFITTSCGGGEDTETEKSNKNDSTAVDSDTTAIVDESRPFEIKESEVYDENGMLVYNEDGSVKIKKDTVWLPPQVDTTKYSVLSVFDLEKGEKHYVHKKLKTHPYFLKEPSCKYVDSKIELLTHLFESPGKDPQVEQGQDHIFVYSGLLEDINRKFEKDKNFDFSSCENYDQLKELEAQYETNLKKGYQLIDSYNEQGMLVFGPDGNAAKDTIYYN